MMCRKGISIRCLFDSIIHFHRDSYRLPTDNLDKLRFSPTIETKGETFYKFVFEIDDEPQDTFLRTDALKKGFETINVFNLGKY